jgi:glycine/serine hydroxymethyltransferase
VQVADRHGALLLCDMAHISGLVAAKEVSSAHVCIRIAHRCVCAV